MPDPRRTYDGNDDISREKAGTSAPAQQVALSRAKLTPQQLWERRMRHINNVYEVLGERMWEIGNSGGR